MHRGLLMFLTGCLLHDPDVAKTLLLAQDRRPVVSANVEVSLPQSSGSQENVDITIAVFNQPLSP